MQMIIKLIWLCKQKMEIPTCLSVRIRWHSKEISVEQIEEGNAVKIICAKRIS